MKSKGRELFLKPQRRELNWPNLALPGRAHAQAGTAPDCHVGTVSEASQMAVVAR